MDANGFDLLAFPSNGDVPFADADENIASMQHALQNGIKYANGGRALKHLGVPCITVPMGTMEDKAMPVGITFASKAWADNDLLRYAFAYENAFKRRTLPTKTPELPTDQIPLISKDLMGALVEVSIRSISVQGILTPSDSDLDVRFTAFVDGVAAEDVAVKAGKWPFDRKLTMPKVHEKYPTLATVPKNHFMLTFVVKTSSGRCAARMLLIE
ncbi:uncharacterized protein BKA55DRAFT_691319 [Fusarium redolens]|uniref:Amidase n=1 Tax=Fusarium redolens TaxID=48865 RepID=A0A9P9GY90_FUSRE|nr:uncharacterized protein BKA55DRAFT_691319 [Fusarium redolens]KAH7247281.1 hypothetical protein BKA55DRAFT_691319 [Fusarium redolens]